MMGSKNWHFAPLIRVTLEELLTVTEAAERLGHPPVTIRYWIRTGQIEAVPLPTRGSTLATA